MRLVELPTVYIVTLGLHEALRKLGFPSEAIFVGQQDDQLVVSVAEDGKYAAFATGSAPTDWRDKWPDVARQWNTAPDGQQQELWVLFASNMSPPKLISALIGRGMYPRKADTK